MPRGFDTTQNVKSRVSSIRDEQFDFVCRYLSQSHWKLIEGDEAAAILDAGLALVLVYEDAPIAADYFSFGRGQADGTRAAQQAQLIQAPSATIIYFSVDYDASLEELEGTIDQYFHGVADALKTFEAASGVHYAAGVYGSGLSCVTLTDKGLAQCGWLAQSRGWRGHDSYSGWSIRQAMPMIVSGVSVDPDDAVGQFGAISPTVSSVAFAS